jgi:hypothetical protein
VIFVVHDAFLFPLYHNLTQSSACSVQRVFAEAVRASHLINTFSLALAHDVGQRL